MTSSPRSSTRAITSSTRATAPRTPDGASHREPVTGRDARRGEPSSHAAYGRLSVHDARRPWRGAGGARAGRLRQAPPEPRRRPPSPHNDDEPPRGAARVLIKPAASYSPGLLRAKYHRR